MLRDGRFTNYTIANGLASNTVGSILEGADGTMWFGTPSGLSSLSRGRWATWRTAEGLPSENVNCLLEDATGVLWVGTASALRSAIMGGFQVPAGEPAELRAQILGLAEDKYGWLWMADIEPRAARGSQETARRHGERRRRARVWTCRRACAVQKA